MHLLIAASPANGSDTRAVVLWSLVLIALLLFAFGAYSYFKKWMKSEDVPHSAGFTLSDLRDLRDQGKMSSEEYEQARSKMVAAAKRMTGQMPEVMTRNAASATKPERPNPTGYGNTGGGSV